MKRLLIVVDFQNDFVDGALGFEGARLLDDVIYDKIQDYRENGWHVAYTFDTHFENYLETREGTYLPVKHCIKDSDGWKIYGRVADTVRDDDKLFYKNTFGSAELFDYLRASDYETVELAGLVSNICIMSNAVLAKTALPEADIIVDAKATASFDNEINSKTLDVLEGLQIIVQRQ